MFTLVISYNNGGQEEYDSLSLDEAREKMDKALDTYPTFIDSIELQAQ